MSCTAPAPTNSYVSPDVWRRRSWIVIGRSAGTSSTPPSPSIATLGSAKAGTYFASGSARNRHPSSTSIIIATETIGFVHRINAKDGVDLYASAARGLLHAEGFEKAELALAGYR